MQRATHGCGRVARTVPVLARSAARAIHALRNACCCSGSVAKSDGAIVLPQRICVGNIHRKAGHGKPGQARLFPDSNCPRKAACLRTRSSTRSRTLRILRTSCSNDVLRPGARVLCRRGRLGSSSPLHDEALPSARLARHQHQPISRDVGSFATPGHTMPISMSRSAAAPGEIAFWICPDDDSRSTAERSTAETLRTQGLSVSETRVPTRRLDEILAEHAPADIDFLKIDVEGLEAEVIGTMSFERWRPRALVVEATRPGIRPDWSNPEAIGTWHAWEPALLGRGYVFAHFDGLNRFYVRNEEQQLALASGCARRLTT